MGIGIKLLMAFNVFLYRLTGGWLGSKMAGQSVLLLRTIGRKSGKSYLIPVNYYRDGEDYVLVASNWGRDHHPGWFFNLMAKGEAEVQVKGRKFRVSARQAEGADYDRLWDFVTGRNEFYVNYQKQTDRKIPIVLLTLES